MFTNPNLYPYIYPLGSILLGVVTLIIFALRKDLRKIIFLLSFILIPFAPIAEYLFFKDYWFPPDVLEFYIGNIRIISGDILMVITVPPLFITLFPFLAKMKIKGLNAISYFTLGRDIFIVQTIYSVIYFTLWFTTNINSIYCYTFSAIILSVLILYKRREFIKQYVFVSLLMGVATFTFYFIYQIFVGDDYLQFVWLLDHTENTVTFFNVLIPLTEVFFGAFVAPFYFLLIFFLRPELELVRE